MTDDHDRMGRMVGDARKKYIEEHPPAEDQALGEEADRSAGHDYCCDQCRREERE